MKYVLYFFLICFVMLILLLIMQQIKSENKEELRRDRYSDAGEATGLHVIRCYERILKPVIDRILALLGLIFLSPIFLLLCIVIYVTDPGPIFFCQKRVGKNKEFFMLHKFRSMKMETPHDMPTHLLENPEQYITSVGKILRKTSLDELPQIWDILIGKMSIIGPRPALWNQYDLIDERDKYGANDVKPGLTGWAQINGRDELEIDDKARLDGHYCENLSFKFDVKCFCGTIISVLKHEGVVEGGTGVNKDNRE